MYWILNTLRLMSMSPEELMADYEKRKVARTEYRDNYGIGVSTVWTEDHGYETALLDANGSHPVERYTTKVLAKKGHKKWIEKSKKIKSIIALGTSDGLIKNKKILLKKIK